MITVTETIIYCECLQCKSLCQIAAAKVKVRQFLIAFILCNIKFVAEKWLHAAELQDAFRQKIFA